MAGSGALIWLVYTQLLPFTGKVGFVILWFIAFLLMYGGVTALGNPLNVVTDRVIASIIRGGALIVFGTLATALGVRLVDQHARMRQRESLARAACREEHGSGAGRRHWRSRRKHDAYAAALG